MCIDVYICIGAWNPMMSHPYYAMSMPPAMPFLGPKQGLSRATSEATGYASATSLGPGTCTGGSFPQNALAATQVPIGGAKKRKNSISYGPLPIPAASYGPPVKKALVPSDLPPPPMTVHITPPLAFNPALSSINQPASYNLVNHPKPTTISPTAKLSKPQSPTRLATTTTTKTPKTKRTHSHPHTTIHTPQDSQAGAAAGLSDEDAASSLLGFYQQLKSSSSDSGSDTGPDGGGSDAGGFE